MFINSGTIAVAMSDGVIGDIGTAVDEEVQVQGTAEVMSYR